MENLDSLPPPARHLIIWTISKDQLEGETSPLWPCGCPYHVLLDSSHFFVRSEDEKCCSVLNEYWRNLNRYHFMLSLCGWHLQFFPKRVIDLPWSSEETRSLVVVLIQGGPHCFGNEEMVKEMVGRAKSVFWSGISNPKTLKNWKGDWCGKPGSSRGDAQTEWLEIHACLYSGGLHERLRRFIETILLLKTSIPMSLSLHLTPYGTAIYESEGPNL